MTDKEQGLRAVARVCAVALVAAALVAPPVSGAGTYKWTDEQGTIHYSDKAPPETPTKGATVLDKQARPVKRI